MKQTEKLTKRMIELSLLNLKEATAFGYWNVIGSMYIKNKASKLHVAGIAKKFSDELDKMPGKVTSQILFYFTTMIKASEYLAAQEHAKAIPILRKGLQQILEYDNKSSANVYGIAINLAACYITQKNYQEGEKLLTTLYANTTEGAYNWYKTCELHFILAMHTQRYPQAEKVFRRVITSQQLKKLPDHLREIWIIYGAYLEILRRSGQLGAATDQKPFRLARYLNDLPTFSRDKRGQNVPVLISHIILLLQTDRYDDLINRLEAIGKYRHRYVRKDDNFRANIFLRMLDQVTKNDFRRKKILRATATLLQQMSTVKVDILDQNYDQEIMPYEDVWDILVPLLDD